MTEDPRTIITPSALSVAPELLGYALAPPFRRLAAIGIDFVLVSIVAGTDVKFLVAVAVALLAWRAIGGPAERYLAGRSRLVLRAATAVLAVVIVSNIWSQGAAWLRSQGAGDVRAPADSAATAAPPEEAAGPGGDALDPDVELALRDLGLSGPEQAALLLGIARLQLADEQEAAARAAELGGWLRSHAGPGAPLEALARALSEELDPDARAALQAALGGVGAAIDTAGADTTAPDTAAADTLARMAAENEQLRQRYQRLDREADELRERVGRLEEGRGLRGVLAGIFDDLGLGLGWFALYFTAFTVLGRGQTPGKRLLGIRVLRLDNRPVGWWVAFERFGGYAASASTGLLGFAQILWDPNRQGLHDKAVGTVVVRLRRGQPFRP